MSDNERFWQTEVGRIAILTVAILLVGVSYDLYWRSKSGPYFSNDESIRWSKARNAEMECMVEMLGDRDVGELESLADADKILWGTAIRRYCEGIDCVVRAKAESQQVFGKELDGWDDTTRNNVLMKHCWHEGMPANLSRLE